MRLVIERRERRSTRIAVAVPVLSIVVSLVLTAGLLRLFGASAAETYIAMFRGAFGSWRALQETLLKSTPLMLASLGVSVAFRIRFWNIGAEGQLVWGGVGAAAVGLFGAPYIPAALLLPAVLLAGMAAGALWGAIPAALNAHWGVDETLTTLMLNYVAILSAEYLYYGPWRDPEGYGFPGTAALAEAAWLPRISGRLHAGIIIALALAVLLWVLFRYSRWGFTTSIVGKNRLAARVQGIGLERTIVVVLLLSGALSGLAGATEVAGVSRRLQEGLAVGYGYTAIIVAWLSSLNPLVVVPGSVLMAGLLVGGDQVQMVMRLPASVGEVIQGMILFPLLAGALFTEHRIRLKRRSTGSMAGEGAEA
ncbi:MAG: ABC transporter permease [Spirochaetes bacterium]|jgi:simple sugar transport system permease protein|nr:ABC transporter permease [Spirochaetota bacterium]